MQITHFYITMSDDANDASHESDGSRVDSDESSESDDNEDPALAVEPVEPEVHNEVPPEPIVAAGRGRGAVRGGAGRGAGRVAGRVAGRGLGRGNVQRGGRAAAGRGNRGARREGGRPMGRSNYSPTEVDHMLESIREYLPISGLEWELVAQRHMQFHPDNERSGDQLKKKFNKLAKTQMGTGDPTMPADVREAKAIRLLIIEKSEGVTGSEDEPFALDDLDEEPADGAAIEEANINGGYEVVVNENALVGAARWRGANGAARADGSVGASSASPREPVSFIFSLFDGFVAHFLLTARKSEIYVSLPSHAGGTSAVTTTCKSHLLIRSC